MAFTPLPPDELQRRLAAIRSFRLIAYLAVLMPVVFVIVAVVLNRLTNGGLHVLVAGAPWTHTLWFSVLGVFFTGCLLLVGVPRSPVSTLRRRLLRLEVLQARDQDHMGEEVGSNVFSGHCMNCKLPIR